MILYPVERALCEFRAAGRAISIMAEGILQERKIEWTEQYKKKNGVAIYSFITVSRSK